MAADNYEIDVTLDQIFGTGISSVEQTVESHEPNGVNEITVTLTNGQTSVFYVRNGDSSGKPTPVATVAEMTDTSAIYLYTGNEEGYVKGDIYCYEGDEWADVGAYGGMIVDEALDADSENAVTNKAITSAIQTLNNKVNSKPGIASGGNKTIILGEVDQDPPSGVYVPTVGLTGALSSLNTTNKNSLTGAINEVKADVNALIAAVGSPLVASTVAGMTDQTKIYVYTGSETGYTSGHWYYYDGSAWADGGIYQSTGIDTDKTLTVANQAADGKAVGDELSALRSAIQQGGSFSAEVKTLIETLFRKVAIWSDDDADATIDQLHNAMFPPATLESISAVYTQGDTVVYETDSLDVLKPDLVVTAHYSDSTSQIVTTYTLSGTLTEGTSTITVSYQGKTTTFNVVVSPPPYWTYEWDYTQGKLEEQTGWHSDSSGTASSELIEDGEKIIANTGAYFQILPDSSSDIYRMTDGYGAIEYEFYGVWNTNSAVQNCRFSIVQDTTNRLTLFINSGKFKKYANSSPSSSANTVLADAPANGVTTKLKLVLKGSKADIYIDDVLAVSDVDATSTAGNQNNLMQQNAGTSYYIVLKSLKIKIGAD